MNSNSIKNENQEDSLVPSSLALSSSPPSHGGDVLLKIIKHLILLVVFIIGLFFLFQPIQNFFLADSNNMLTAVPEGAILVSELSQLTPNATKWLSSIIPAIQQPIFTQLLAKEPRTVFFILPTNSVTNALTYGLIIPTKTNSLTKIQRETALYNRTLFVKQQSLILLSDPLDSKKTKKIFSKTITFPTRAKLITANDDSSTTWVNKKFLSALFEKTFGPQAGKFLPSYETKNWYTFRVFRASGSLPNTNNNITLFTQTSIQFLLDQYARQYPEILSVLSNISKENMSPYHQLLNQPITLLITTDGHYLITFENTALQPSAFERLMVEVLGQTFPQEVTFTLPDKTTATELIVDPNNLNFSEMNDFRSLPIPSSASYFTYFWNNGTYIMSDRLDQFNYASETPTKAILEHITANCFPEYAPTNMIMLSAHALAASFAALSSLSEGMIEIFAALQQASSLVFHFSDDHLIEICIQ